MTCSAIFVQRVNRVDEPAVVLPDQVHSRTHKSSQHAEDPFFPGNGTWLPIPIHYHTLKRVSLNNTFFFSNTIPGTGIHTKKPINCI